MPKYRRQDGTLVHYQPIPRTQWSTTEIINALRNNTWAGVWTESMLNDEWETTTYLVVDTSDFIAELEHAVDPDERIKGRLIKESGDTFLVVGV